MLSIEICENLWYNDIESIRKMQIIGNLFASFIV